MGGNQFMPLTGTPPDMEVISQTLEKTLSNGMLVEVFLVKRPRQYEAALFIGGKYKPGPPIPRPIDNPTPTAAYWMGVHPSVGFSEAEGDEILAEVNVQNRTHHCYFSDKWGKVDDD
jgi:hypothetical protein